MSKAKMLDARTLRWCSRYCRRTEREFVAFAREAAKPSQKSLYESKSLVGYVLGSMFLSTAKRIERKAKASKGRQAR